MLSKGILFNLHKGFYTVTRKSEGDFYNIWTQLKDFWNSRLPHSNPPLPHWPSAELLAKQPRDCLEFRCPISPGHYKSTFLIFQSLKASLLLSVHALSCCLIKVMKTTEKAYSHTFIFASVICEECASLLKFELAWIVKKLKLKCGKVSFLFKKTSCVSLS